jgi:hypothetical protein
MRNRNSKCADLKPLVQFLLICGLRQKPIDLNNLFQSSPLRMSLIRCVPIAKKEIYNPNLVGTFK